MKNQDHPAVKFGKWLTKVRKANTKLCAREFAERIGLSFIEYSEVELGIIKHLTSYPINKINEILNNSEFFGRLAVAFESPLIDSLNEIFDRKDLEPCYVIGKNGAAIYLTQEQKEKLIDIVLQSTI